MPSAGGYASVRCWGCGSRVVVPWHVAKLVVLREAVAVCEVCEDAPEGSGVFSGEPLMVWCASGYMVVPIRTGRPGVPRSAADEGGRCRGLRRGRQ